MLKEYNHNEIETKWSEKYKNADIFRGKPNQKPYFSVVLPPPNVTGSLHIGHALNATLQDIMVRYKRMKGFNTLWLPGFDHAGIATQWVIVRELQKEGISRFDLGRENFVKRVWQWVPKSRDSIKNQLIRIGASCDWSRQRFTLDEGFSRAVREAFVKLHKEGLIFKAPYIVNWDPKERTAISDLEVEYYEEKGKLWYIRYPLEDGSGYIVVATTRPETMLGDTAVAVNPNDERYKHLIGKKVLLPLAPEERTDINGNKVSNLIPIIADEYVDPAFGTGVVKITPAHDPNDFEVGKRHNLPMVIVMDEGAYINKNGGEFEGLYRYDARKKIVEKLKELGLLEKEEDHIHNVGHSQRSKEVIEPYLSTQWFVDTKKLAEKAIKVVEEGKIKFIPEGWTKTYLNWMYNIREWCISRQIWWGHRIPVWYCKDCSHINSFNDEFLPTIEEKIIFNLYADGKINQIFCLEDILETLNQQNFTHPDKTNLQFYEEVVFLKKADKLKTKQSLIELLENSQHFKKLYDERYQLILKCEKCGSENLHQEEDVLDTWFSSALWPFGTLGWPEKTQDLDTFYPTSLLITGFDIIFFWVARMIMMGTKFTDNVPFEDVYIHALVRDEKGEKMSKTKGNVIDPLEMAEKYGADALRFTLTALAAQGRDIRLSEKRIEGYKHFSNKIWNASKFVLTNSQNVDIKPVESLNLSLEDKWILTAFEKALEKSSNDLENYRYNDYANTIYDFFWHDYCDWYIELTKERIYKGSQEEKETALSVLNYILRESLKLLHPIMPFITEEIYQYLPIKETEFLAVAPYPEFRQDFVFEKEYRFVEDLKEMIVSIRTVRSDFNIEPTRKLNVRLKPSSKEIEENLKKLANQIKLLIKAEDLTIDPQAAKKDTEVVTVSKLGESFIDLAGILDIQKEIQRQEKLLQEVEKSIKISEGKLSNENFVNKAPPNVVEKEKQLYEELKQKREKILSILSMLKNY
ncbi:MAG: valine--tRNA ligase, partial [Sulfurihydrogenibium sp.]|uniref:valine--tRNA ligase n=1 Tax=Sulfurihydrogenibium sp. TaxID=2053621 RepID=UPI003D13B6DF